MTTKLPKSTYVSECGYHVQCVNAKNNQVCMYTKNVDHITLTKTDLEYILSLM